jgi:hypothetical protein
MTMGQAIKQPMPTSQAPILLKQKLSMKDFKHDENDIDGEPVNKKTCLGLENRAQLHRNLIPSGLKWINNSCACESFVILYSLFRRDEIKWTTHFQSYQNSALNNILEEFQKLLQNETTFEQVRDHIREALQADNYNCFRVGQFTSLLTLWDHILRTPQAVQMTSQQCENGHKHCR